MLGVLSKIFKVVTHPISAMVVRSIDEALDLVITWVEDRKDGLTEDEKRRLRIKIDALVKSLMGL